MSNSVSSLESLPLLRQRPTEPPPFTKRSKTCATRVLEVFLSITIVLYLISYLTPYVDPPPIPTSQGVIIPASFSEIYIHASGGPGETVINVVHFATPPYYPTEMTSIQHQKLAKSGSLHRGIKVSPNYSGPQKFTINITYPSQPKWNLFDRNSLPSVHLVMLLPIEIQNLTVIGDRVNLLWGGPNIANDIAVESGQLSTSGIRFTSPLSSRNIAIKAGMGRIELNHVQASGVVLLENDSDSGIVAFIKGYTNFSAISKTGGMRLDLAPGVEASWTEVVTEGKLGSAINLAIRGFQGRYYLKGGLSMNGSVFPPESLSPAVGYIGSKEGKGNLKAITNTWMPLRVDFDPPEF